MPDPCYDYMRRWWDCEPEMENMESIEETRFPDGVLPLPLPPNRRLSNLGVEVSGIETWKLDSHLEHCSKLAHNAEQLYQSTQAAAKAAEMKLDSQRLALESHRLHEQVLQPPACSHGIRPSIGILFGFRTWGVFLMQRSCS